MDFSGNGVIVVPRKVANMTVNDFLRRIQKSDYDKVIVLCDGEGGWTNVELPLEITESAIKLYPSHKNSPFTDDT